MWPVVGQKPEEGPLLAHNSDEALELRQGPIAAAPHVINKAQGNRMSQEGTLACLESGAERFDPSHVEGVSVDAGAVAGWAERIAALGRTAREELPIEADRAELLPAGLTCLAATMVRLEARRATTSALGLRHAVVNELLVRS